MRLNELMGIRRAGAVAGKPAAKGLRATKPTFVGWVSAFDF